MRFPSLRALAALHALGHGGAKSDHKTVQGDQGDDESFASMVRLAVEEAKGDISEGKRKYVPCVKSYFPFVHSVGQGHEDSMDRFVEDCVKIRDSPLPVPPVQPPEAPRPEFLTLLHGEATAGNFLFKKNGNEVEARAVNSKRGGGSIGPAARDLVDLFYTSTEHELR